MFHLHCTSVNGCEISHFARGLFLRYAKFRKNVTLAKISEFAVSIAHVQVPLNTQLFQISVVSYFCLHLLLYCFDFVLFL